MLTLGDTNEVSVPLLIHLGMDLDFLHQRHE